MYKNIKFFFLLVTIALTMNSCFDNTGIQTTPTMFFGNLLINPILSGDSILGAKDTLSYRVDEEFGQTYLDSMLLGDTLMFNSLFSSEANNLVSIEATFDTARVQLWFGIDMEDSNMKLALQTTSQPERGVLYFNPMYQLATFPIYIVPMEGGNHPIKLTVVSDSEYSTASSLFTIPVKQ